MDWNNYHRLDVIHSFIEDLENKYPSVCTSGSIGKSLEGRDLKVNMNKDIEIIYSIIKNNKIYIEYLDIQTSCKLDLHVGRG